MIHRVVFGSIERFIGILIEHYAGKFPLWLAPVQVKVLPISDKFAMYAEDISQMLKSQGIRCEIDKRDEKIGYKIREAQLEKVPYMIIVGQKELENHMISVRDRDEGDKGMLVFDEFMNMLHLNK
jgi:threonyl-tRNA synthetase